MPKYYDFKDGKLLIDVTALSKNRSVFIATPSYNLPQSEYVDSLTLQEKELAKCGINYKRHTHRGNSAADLARCMCVAAFLESGMSDLLFIDDDLQWLPNELVKMLALDLPVYGGTYGKKFLFADRIDAAIIGCDYASLPKEKRISLLVSSGVEATHKDKPGGKVIAYPDGREIAREANKLPGGFMLIQRWVFETLMEKRPDLKFKIDDTSSINEFMYAFFQHTLDLKEGTWCGEDYYFTDLVRSCGIEVWRDCQNQIGHIGKFCYQCDPSKTLH